MVSHGTPPALLKQRNVLSRYIGSCALPTFQPSSRKLLEKWQLLSFIKKFSTSWPHEHPGRNFPLAFITISQKQEQGQLVDSVEEPSRLWCAPLHWDSSALPVLGLLWEMCLSNCPCFQSFLQDPQISYDARDCHRMETALLPKLLPKLPKLLPKLTLSSHCPLRRCLCNTGGSQKWCWGSVSRFYAYRHAAQGLELRVPSSM